MLNANRIGLNFGNESLNCMTDMIKNYFKQPSTWLGLLKWILAAFGVKTGHVDALGAAALTILGTVDVIRNEKL